MTAGQITAPNKATASTVQRAVASAAGAASAGRRRGWSIQEHVENTFSWPRAQYDRVPSVAHTATGAAILVFLRVLSNKA